MKLLFALVALAASTAAGTCAAQEAAAPRQPLVIATGEVSGYYYPVGGAVCRILNRDADKAGPRCLVEPTSGNAANLQQLRKGDVDLAVMQSRALAQARAGEGPFADQGAFPALRAVAALHSEPVLVLVSKAAKIRSLADLKGKKVNLGRPNSFQRMMAEMTLAVAGLSASDLGTALEIEFDQQPVGLCDGRLEAAFFTGIHPMQSAEQALEECGVEVLDLKGKALQEAVTRNPFLATSVIAAETYPGIESDTTTIGMKAVLVTTASLPESAAALVAKSLADNFRSFVDQIPALRGSTRDGLAHDGIAVPLHPGAEKAYRESGLLK